MRRDVEAILRSAAEDEGRISLAGGLPAEELFPRELIAEAAEAAIAPREARAALQYGWPEGEPEIREWVASRLRARGADVTAEDVIVTAGAQQAMNLAANVLIHEGTRVRVDRASYAGALDLFRTRKAKLTTVLDERVEVAYAMPGLSNPLGFDATAALVSDLLELRCPVIADEAYTDLRFDGRIGVPLMARARDSVWHVGTVSKTLAPGLRVGWLVPPRARVDEVREAKQRDDLQAGALAQHVLERVLDKLDYDAHVAKARHTYASRARALVDAVRDELPDLEVRDPEGGFCVLATARADFSELELLARASELGVVFDPGTAFLPRKKHGVVALRLCYSNHAEDELREGVRRLAAAWRELDSPIKNRRASRRRRSVARYVA